MGAVGLCVWARQANARTGKYGHREASSTALLLFRFTGQCLDEADHHDEHQRHEGEPHCHRACLDALECRIAADHEQGDRHQGDQQEPQDALAWRGVGVAEPQAGGTISSCTFISHRCHASIGVFGAVSVASACLVDGSVTQGLAHVELGETLHLSVEHPTGEFTVDLHQRDGALVGCGLLRTARLLLDGALCIPASIWSPG